MKKQFYRVKQLADQTFSRSGKEEALTDELQTADRKVEHLRNALQLVSKRLVTCAGSTQGQDPAAREKRLKKLPEYLLGLSMCEASNFDDDDSILKYILQECGKTEKFLANEIAEHELKVEQLVCMPLATISDQDLPAIMKAKKQLSRLISEKESAASKYNHLERQKEDNPGKLGAARDELEEAGGRVEAARDALAADMFALVAKEAQLAHTLLQYVKLQRAYHESALHSLQDTVPELERFINDSAVKPVFGYPLEEHLRVTSRSVAWPVELCVCALHELALNEEGLFRIAGGSSKVRRMKLSLDAGLFSVPLPRDYRDAHVVASVLKSYLRELPEPLLTYRLYEAFLAAARRGAEQARLAALWETVHLLPEANYNNLRYLVKFLAALTKNVAANKMTPSNLAIVIAPNLLWAADDGAFDMGAAAVLNCGVELLITHADWFFKEDVPFFVTFTREDLLPDQCEYGFGAGFAAGCPQTAALALDANGDDAGGRHSRSNSHDTSLILLDAGMKKAQSSSSLSDQSSPPHGSPKPVTRRKNKPLAPVPPAFTPDRARRSEAAQTDPLERPAKPPRPALEPARPVSGVQTINRSTYRQQRALKEEARSSSRDDLLDLRRQSLELDKDVAKLDIKSDGRSESIMARSMTAQSASVGKMRLGEKPRPPGQPPPPRPVAAPRSLPAPAPAPADEDVLLRAKPAVPERPPQLRPHSFRARLSDADPAAPAPAAAAPAAAAPAGPAAALERAHVYSVDKQQPTVITVRGEDEARVTVQRTHSSGGKDADEPRLTSHSRQLSHSEGSITDAPPSPRPAARPPRPTVPAPPPPAAPPAAAAAAAPAHESTNL